MLGRALLVEDSLARELAREFTLDRRKVWLSHNLVVLLYIPRKQWELIADYLRAVHRRDVVDLRGTVQWCAVFATVPPQRSVPELAHEPLHWAQPSRWSQAGYWLARRLPTRVFRWLFAPPQLRSGQHRVDSMVNDPDRVVPLRAREEEG